MFHMQLLQQLYNEIVQAKYHVGSVAWWISLCWCIDPMVGATSLYDVTLHWRVMS